MRRIHLLCVTGRPWVFKETIAFWMGRSVHKERIVIKVAVDTFRHARELIGFNTIVTEPKILGVAYPAYCLTTTYEDSISGDILVLWSDDFYAPEKWDEWMYDNVGNDECVVVNDGITGIEADAVTIPIMGDGAFRKLNKIIYNKAYAHMFADSEVFYNCKDLGILRNLRGEGDGYAPIFEHRHYANEKRPKDVLDEQNQGRFYEDQGIFEERMKLSIKDRLE